MEKGIFKTTEVGKSNFLSEAQKVRAEKSGASYVRWSEWQGSSVTIHDEHGEELFYMKGGVMKKSPVLY